MAKGTTPAGDSRPKIILDSGLRCLLVCRFMELLGAFVLHDLHGYFSWNVLPGVSGLMLFSSLEIHNLTVKKRAVCSELLSETLKAMELKSAHYATGAFYLLLYQ